MEKLFKYFVSFMLTFAFVLAAIECYLCFDSTKLLPWLLPVALCIVSAMMSCVMTCIAIAREEKEDD